MGGSPWHQLYSNVPMLVPFIVCVCVGGKPWHCVPNVLMIQCWWLCGRSNNKLGLRRVVRTGQLLSGCCFFLWLVSHILCAWHEDRHVTYEWDGLLPGPWAPSRVGRSRHKIIMWSPLWRFITESQDRHFRHWFYIKRPSPRGWRIQELLKKTAGKRSYNVRNETKSQDVYSVF